MIYSNFPTALIAKRQHSANAQIRIGEDGINRRSISLNCCAGLLLEQGMNENLNIYCAEEGELKICEYKEDWRNFDDPRWNIPNDLFLIITSNFNEKNPNICKYGNGLIFSLKDDVIKNFKLYARGNGAAGKMGNKGIWTYSIYKLLTNAPSIIRILPAGYQKTEAYILTGAPIYEYLVIKDHKIFKCSSSTLEQQLQVLNLPKNFITGKEWCTL